MLRKERILAAMLPLLAMGESMSYAVTNPYGSINELYLSGRERCGTRKAIMTPKQRKARAKAMRARRARRINRK